MTIVERAAPWSDDRGNRIEGEASGDVKVQFRGQNSRVVFFSAVTFHGVISMDCDNSLVELGEGCSFKGNIRAGLGSRVIVGKGITATGPAILSAVEYASIMIGDDCMFAQRNEIRTDDGHPIYDRKSGRRINVSRDILIGDHVWLGNDVLVTGGSTIGNGCTIGTRSLVTSTIPPNCIAVGTPARVIREDIAWERPHLSLSAPHFFPDREPYG